VAKQERHSESAKLNQSPKSADEESMSFFADVFTSWQHYIRRLFALFGNNKKIL